MSNIEQITSAVIAEQTDAASIGILRNNMVGTTVNSATKYRLSIPGATPPIAIAIIVKALAISADWDMPSAQGHAFRAIRDASWNSIVNLTTPTVDVIGLVLKTIFSNGEAALKALIPAIWGNVTDICRDLWERVNPDHPFPEDAYASKLSNLTIGMTISTLARRATTAWNV